MSTNINKSVKQLLTFAGENVTRNLVSATRQKMIEISENDLRKISVIVESTMTQSLTNGYNGVEKAIKAAISEVSVDEKMTKTRRK